MAETPPCTSMFSLAWMDWTWVLAASQTITLMHLVAPFQIWLILAKKYQCPKASCRRTRELTIRAKYRCKWEEVLKSRITIRLAPYLSQDFRWQIVSVLKIGKWIRGRLEVVTKRGNKISPTPRKKARNPKDKESQLVDIVALGVCKLLIRVNNRWLMAKTRDRKTHSQKTTTNNKSFKSSLRTNNYSSDMNRHRKFTCRSSPVVSVWWTIILTFLSLVYSAPAVSQSIW